MLQALKSRIGSFFGYDAVENKGRRRFPTPNSNSEDRELDSYKRRQLVASARDQARNFAIAAWAIRKHLDFVSRFNFDCSSGNDAFDDQFESLMADASEVENFDICARHDRNRWLRIYEARACVDGDILGVMLKSGHLQAVESDRIKSKEAIDDQKMAHGVSLDKQGRATGYQIWRREPFGYMTFEREIKAENCLFHGYFDRFDQVRGISPLAPGLNSLQDVYENVNYALIKAKVSQLFGLAFSRDAETAPAPIGEDAAESADDGPRYNVNFGRGPIMLDMEQGDDVKILESSTPSTQFQDFMTAVIQISLKSLDIPYCFYDESHTNFYGSRAAVMLYIESCKTKRDNLRRILQQYKFWKARQFVAEGKLILPVGMRPETVPGEWIHAGLPWWDPEKEINASNQEVKSGFNSRRRIRKEKYGDDWFKIIDELAEENEYAEKKGVVLESVVLPQPEVDPADPKEEKPTKKPTKKQGAAA